MLKLNITELIICVLGIHWIADFIFQSQEIAKNKYKYIDVLLKHIMQYMFISFGLHLLINGAINHETLAYWIIINTVLHFIVDFITSKITHYLYEKNEIHMFFVVIGLDQLLHYICLFTTLNYFKII